MDGLLARKRRLKLVLRAADIYLLVVVAANYCGTNGDRAEWDEWQGPPSFVTLFCTTNRLALPNPRYLVVPCLGLPSRVNSNLQLGQIFEFWI